MTDDPNKDEWSMILAAKESITPFLAKVSRLPIEAVEDCVSEAMIDFVSTFDRADIGTAANLAYVERDTIIFSRIKKLANTRISATRRMMGKSVSDDTPIGEEDGDMRLRDLFIPRTNTAERIENYAEWRMFERKGGCPYTLAEIEDIFGFSKPVEI